MSEPIVLTEGQYWKLRAIEANRQLLNEQIANAVGSLDKHRNEHFESCGLDPKVGYSLDDKSLTVTPQD